MDEDIPIEQVQMVPSLDASLLPTYQQYKADNASWMPRYDIWNYLSQQADLELAAAFVTLVWPDFVEVDDCILLRSNYSPEAFAQWLERYSGNRRAVEAMINHVHMLDLFQVPQENSGRSEQLYEYLAHALLFGWKSALEEAFPGRQFVFTLRHGYGPEISFHQADLLMQVE